MHAEAPEMQWDLDNETVLFAGKKVGQLADVGPKLVGTIEQLDMTERLRRALFFIHEVGSCPTCGASSMEVRTEVQGVEIGTCRGCGTPIYRIGLDVYRQRDNKLGYVRSVVKGLVV